MYVALHPYFRTSIYASIHLASFSSPWASHMNVSSHNRSISLFQTPLIRKPKHGMLLMLFPQWGKKKTEKTFPLI